MPTPQNLTLQAAINGGAPVTGGLTVAASATVLLSPVDPSGIRKLLYEIYEWPLGWVGPAAGWTYDAAKDRWYVYTAGSPAPIFSLPAIALWGKFLFRATANDALRDGSYAADLVDERTAVQVLSATGLYDAAFGETNQFEGRRQWMGAIKRVLRLIAAAGVGSAAAALIDHGATGSTETIDFTAGPRHKAVVDQNTTITITVPVLDGQISSIVLSYSGGAHTLAWVVTGGTFRWLGAAPTLDTTGLLQVISCMRVGTDILAQATPAG